ncbi:hypothetical protein ACN28I_34340 [Archangium gephyra]|uniref:hypothetical protein n=1 Tax=Archangium gephyra TaxID=48 RepID=UPI003B812E6B
MTTERYYYDFFGSKSESRWNVEKDIPWGEIDREAALSQPDILDKVRRTALIESYHALGTVSLIKLLHEDVDATSVFQVECFEGFRHFWSLRRYLDLVGFEPRITDEELVEIRRRNIDHVNYQPEDTVQELVNFIWSEHAAGYFARQLGAQCKDKVLAKLLGFISTDEFRHAEGGYQILTKLLERKPEAQARGAARGEQLQALRLARVRAAGGGGERLHHGAADEAQVREGVRRAHRELARGVGQPSHHAGQRGHAAARAPLEQPPSLPEHRHGF